MDKAARAALLTAKRKDNKSENIADYVAELLRQGRASEVTDDLMAQADPQRLHHHYTSGNTGMDLPMDYASRMERAAKMGFQNKSYHGTSQKFPHFSLDAPSATRVKSRAVFSTDNPDVASGYGHSVMPIMTKADVPISFDFSGRSRTHFNNNEYTPSQLANEIRQTRDDARRYGSEVETDKAYDLENAGAEPMYADEIDAVHMKNINDTNDMFNGQIANHTATLDPTNIRSQFARFDPRLEHLAHLSASTGGAMGKGDEFETSSQDASHIFGNGAVYRWYRHPKSGGYIQILQRPNVPASVIGLEVPEEFRGQGIGQALQAEAMRNHPSLMGQVSSKAAAKTAYRLGRRPYGNPNASLDDVFNGIDQDSSINLMTPEAQPKLKSTGGAMEFARHVEAVNRAGGQIAPSKYLPNVPRQVHAGGGRENGDFEVGKKYNGVIPQIKYLPVHAIERQPSEHEVSRVSDDVAKNMDFSEPVEATAFRYGSNHSEDHPSVALQNGHHRLAAARQTGRPHLPVTLTAVNAKGEKLNALKALSDEIERSMITKAGGGDVEGDDDGITAYHGSPHSFDQFDISKLGTGEGAQAYGHGLYFAGNEKIAKHYRDTLTKSNPYTAGQYYDVDGETIRYPWNGGTYDPRALAAKMIDDANGDTNLASKRALDVHSSGDTTQNWLGVAEEAKKINNVKRINEIQGHMYKVKINAGPHELLDWDKPLSEQHPRVQRAIKEWNDWRPASEKIPKEIIQGSGIEPNGSHVYQHMANIGQPNDGNIYGSNAKGQEFASGELSDLGLKGIRYRDAGSRDLSDGDPTHNYVMFHHDPVQVVDKYEYGGTVGKEDGGAMGDGITAYHGSPYSFDQFDISKLGTGEGNQSYGHGLYFAGNEKVAKYYRDALTDPEQTHLHFDQRPVDTPWNEEIRARWPEHFAGKSQRDQDAMEEALGNLSQVNNLKDVPNALSNMSAAAKYMYQRHIKPKLTKPDLGKGHMYKVQLQVKPSELLDWDKPLSEQHPEVQKALNENLRKSNNLKKFMIENPTGGELHEALSDKGSYRDQISASEQLLAAGLKGIKYRDADSRDLSDGDATHNYVMFHHDPIKVMSKYEYGGTVDRALALTRRFTKNGKAATASLKKKPL